MMRVASRALLLGLLAVVACDPGGVDGGGGPNPGGPDANDGRDMPLGIVCNATFKTQGSFVQSMAQPADISGCWPIGTWTFTATVDSNKCPTAPSVLPSYEFKVDWVVDADGNGDYTYTVNLPDPALHYRVHVSGDGGGLCQGGFEIFSADGKQMWNMKPSLETGNVLDGFGEYALYNTDQWN